MEEEGLLFDMNSLEELNEHLIVMKESLIEEMKEEKSRASEILLIVINKLLQSIEKTDDLNELPLAKQVEFMAYLHLFLEQTEAIADDFEDEVEGDEWDDGFDDEFDEELEEELSTLEEEEEL